MRFLSRYCCLRFALPLIAAACLTGCGPSSSISASTAKKGSKGTVGVSVLTLGNPFFRVIADNLRAELEKAGYKANVVSGEGCNTLLCTLNRKSLLLSHATAAVTIATTATTLCIRPALAFIRPSTCTYLHEKAYAREARQEDELAAVGLVRQEGLVGLVG